MTVLTCIKKLEKLLEVSPRNSRKTDGWEQRYHLVKEGEGNLLEGITNTILKDEIHGSYRITVNLAQGFSRKS